MLQFNKTRPFGQQGLGSAELISPSEVYEAAVGFFRRQFRVIVFAVLLSLAVGVVYIISSPPTYTGRAVLVIDPHKAQAFQGAGPIGDLPMDSTAVDTQIQVITSDNVAQSVIKDLRLNEDPEFISPRAGLVGTLVGLINSAVNSILNTFIPTPVDEPTPDDLIMQRALSAFHSRLKVQRVALTYAIEIDFDSLSPDRAAQIANAVGDAYVVDSLEAKYQTTKRASEWLQDRLKELREQSSNAERAVVDYKAKNNIVDTGGRLMNEQQLAELNSELIQTRAQTAEAKARLDRVQQILGAGEFDPSAATTATVADTLHNDVISKLRSQYLEYDARASDWAQKYGQNHLAVVNLRNQMNEIRRSIAEELKRTAETYKSDYEIAKQREQSIQRSLDQIVTDSQTTNEASVTLHNLESNAQTYRALYDNFLQRYMESVQQQSFPISEARIISKAKRPLSKSAPRSHVALALAGLAGLILGAGLGMLRDISDRVFRTSSQIAERLRADCISLVPFVKSTPVPGNVSTPANDSLKPAPAGIAKADSLAEKGRQPAEPDAAFATTQAQPVDPVTADQAASEQGTSISVEASSAPEIAAADAPIVPSSPSPRLIVRDSSARWLVIDSPLSRYAEAIRAIKVATDLEHVGKSNKVIGITSSLPNEGKSTVAVSLAALIAHSGRRAILVDCDLRNPSLSKALTPHAKLGILDLIDGKAELDDVSWKEEVSGLTFLPAVVPRRLLHSSEILASQPTRALFEKLRGTFDYVIVDLSPLAPVVDVRVITAMIDSFIFVVEWGRTKIDVVEHALSNAQGVYDNLLGVVLNKTNMNALSRYENTRGNYYYNRYYSRYGYSD